MMTTLIQQQADGSTTLPVARMCELVQLPRRSYYHLLGHSTATDSHIELRNSHLSPAFLADAVGKPDEVFGEACRHSVASPEGITSGLALSVSN
jgi:hypothetical protein